MIRIAQVGLVQAKWTDQILDEVFGNLKEDRPDISCEALDRTRELMLAAVRDCLVTGYEPLVESVVLPDPGDRHVLAVAIRVRAHVIVTSNPRDFPRDTLADRDIEAKSPDESIVDQISLDRKVVWSCAQRIADSWRHPPGTVEDVLTRLERGGLVQAVAEPRAEQGPLARAAGFGPTGCGARGDRGVGCGGRECG